MRLWPSILALTLSLGATLAAAPQDASVAESNALSAAIQSLLQGDAAVAEERFRMIVASSPELAEAWLGLAESRRLQGDPAEGLEHARRARAVNGDLPGVPLTIARLLIELGSNQEALVELDTALNLEPDSVDALLLSSLVLRDLGKDADATELLARAWDRGVRAATIAEQLSMLQLSAGAVEEALETSEAGLRIESGRPSLLLARGLSLAAIPDRRAEAIDALSAALDTGVLPQQGRLHLEIGSILAEQNRYEEALVHLEAARGELDEEAAVYYQLAITKRALGDRDGALADMDHFEELSNQSDAGELLGTQVGIALNEAQALAGQNRLEDALGHVNAILADHPDEAPALALHAKILFAMGRRTEAEISISRAREILPTHPEYQFLAGLFRMYAGLPEEAEEPLRRALAIDPDLAEAHALLGGSLAKQGRSEESIVHFQRALDLGIDQPDVRLGYAGALEDLGRKSDADEQMDAYRRLTAAN